MLDYSLFSKLTDDFQNNFKKDLRKSEKKEFETIFYINRSRIRDIALYLHEKGAALLNISITDLGSKFELIHEYYIKLVKESKFWFIISELDKKANEIDSIEIIYPSVKFVEKEITKRFGLKFASFTEDIGKELFAVPTPLNPEEFELNLAPVGVYNKVHKSNYYFHLQLDKDKIVGVVEKTGWLYRGILPLLQTKNAFDDNIRLTKRITASSSIHHNLSYITAIEQLYNLSVQNRSKLLRTLLCELERYENHLLWFANLLLLLGYKRRYYYLLKRRLDLQRLYIKYFGKRFLENMNYIGYTENIAKEKLAKIKIVVENLFPLLLGTLDYFIYKKFVRERCQGIGILKKEDAIDAGVTGPCLRASGIDFDLRFEKPYLNYLDRDIASCWDIVVFEEGDVFARIESRLWEMKNSYTIIIAILQKLIDDSEVIESLDLSKINLTAKESSIVQFESPQGELMYYIKAPEQPAKKTIPMLGGIYIATPSLKNFLALNNFILKENKISDFALIVHSMDLNFNEIDL